MQRILKDDIVFLLGDFRKGGEIMNNKLIWVVGAIVIVVAVIGGVFLLGNKSTGTPTASTTGSQSPTVSQQAPVEDVNVALTSSGFVPQTVTVKIGGRVIWTNKSGVDGTVNSDVYPTNLLWPFLNLGLFSNGSSVSVTFDKPGKYTYHNHLSPTQTGTVIAR